MSNLPAIKNWLQSDLLKTQVSQALPKHITPDRFMRIAMTAVQKQPKLMNCSQASLFTALITCSELGIEPDGRRAHLIPYKDQCQLIIDYKGLVELVMRSGEVSKIHADVVCENDDFEVNMGEITAHKIDYRKPRGEAYAVYSVVTLKDGNTKAEVMTRDEVEKIRKSSKAANNGPWVEHWNEMAKKTVFRRLSKWLPLSPELKENLAKDDDQFDPSLEVRQAPSRQHNAEMTATILSSLNPGVEDEIEEVAEEVAEEVTDDASHQLTEKVHEDEKSAKEDDIKFINTYKRFLTDKQKALLDQEMQTEGFDIDKWKDMISKAYSDKKK